MLFHIIYDILNKSRNYNICKKNNSSPFQSTAVSNIVTPDKNDSNLKVVDVTENSSTTSFISTQFFPGDNNTNMQNQNDTTGNNSSLVIKNDVRNDFSSKIDL